MAPLAPERRAALFFGVCMPLRTALALSVAAQTRLAPAAGALYLLFGVGMMGMYLAGARPAAPEGGGVTWWASFRWLFALIYMAGAYAGLTEDPGWPRLVPLLDIAVGVGAWLRMRPG